MQYIQMKANVSSVLWILGNGFGMSYLPTKLVFKGHTLGNTLWLGGKDAYYYLCADKTTRFSELNKEIQEELLKDPLHVCRVRKVFDERKSKYSRYLKDLKEKDFSLLSNVQLLKYYQKILTCYYDVYPYGEPISLMSKDFIEGLQADFCGKKGGSEEEFYKLVFSPDKSFLQREEEELLAIALKAKKCGITNEIKKLLQKHTKEFTWIPYDYGANYYSQEHFTRELSKLLKLGSVDLKLKYQRLKSYKFEINKKQKELFTKYSFTRKEINFFRAAQDCYYLVDSKKEFFTELHWYSNRVFDEISRRLKLDGNLVRYTLPEEMENYLLGKKKIDLKRLKDRLNYFLIITRADGKLDLTEGEEAKKIVTKFLAEYHQVDKGAKEIKGRTAQPGRVSGRVRIIMDAKECDKVKHGDVLVTAMTSPDFMLAVKRAVAIVTDEGGITCHAAVIARELSIPCIIGTKNATKVLHDDDEVEVDAEKGIVKIIK